MILFLCYWGLFLGEKCIIVYTINYRKSFGTESLDMKKYLIISAIFIAWWFSPAFAEENPQAALPVVLLELFTSQGAILARQRKNYWARILPVALMSWRWNCMWITGMIWCMVRPALGRILFPRTPLPEDKGTTQKNTQYRKRFYAASHRARQIQRQRHQSREYQ